MHNLPGKSGWIDSSAGFGRDDRQKLFGGNCGESWLQWHIEEEEAADVLINPVSLNEEIGSRMKIMIQSFTFFFHKNKFLDGIQPF